MIKLKQLFGCALLSIPCVSFASTAWFSNFNSSIPLSQLLHGQKGSCVATDIITSPAGFELGIGAASGYHYVINGRAPFEKGDTLVFTRQDIDNAYEKAKELKSEAKFTKLTSNLHYLGLVKISCNQG